MRESKLKTRDMPKFSFVPESPIFQCLIMEHTMLAHGYTYSDIEKMTVEQVIIRAMVFGGTELLNQPKEMF